MTTTDRTAEPQGAAAADGGRRLSIAMIGTRGVPARYGGFETAVEEGGGSPPAATRFASTAATATPRCAASMPA